MATSYLGPINLTGTYLQQDARTVELISRISTGGGLPPSPPLPSEGDVTRTVQVDVVDPDATPEVMYKGEASPGVATSTAAWRIQRITIQSDGDVTILHADGNTAFDNVWDNRASLSYS